MALKWSLQIVGGHAEELIQDAKDAETGGFDCLWAFEGQESSLVCCAMLATNTKKIKLGAGVTIAFVRTPLDTALAALDISYFSHNRFILGLGTGLKGPIEHWHGDSFARPIPRLREYTVIVRALLAAVTRDQAYDFEGEFYRVHYRDPRPYHAEGIPLPPIIYGVTAPLASTAAGELTEGLLGNVIATPFWTNRTIWPNVDKGLAKAGKTRADFEMSGTLVCAIDDKDPARAHRDAAKVVAFYAEQPRNLENFVAHGFEREARAILATPDKEAQLQHVSEAMRNAYCASGTAAEVRKGAQRWEGAADAVRLIPPPAVISFEEAGIYQRAIIETFSK